jgi:hypothetical protein
VLTLQGAMNRDAASRQTLCAEGIGFGLQAAVRCSADDHHVLEQLRPRVVPQEPTC